jgi:hypothetical protein
MKSEELRELTASEALTLEEEYEMQSRSFRVGPVNLNVLFSDSIDREMANRRRQ